MSDSTPNPRPKPNANPFPNANPKSNSNPQNEKKIYIYTHLSLCSVPQVL